MASLLKAAGRSASGRLRDAPHDPLESVGLPSKGDTRHVPPHPSEALGRHEAAEAQETYYATIVERYMKFCAAAGGGGELERQFAALSMGDGGAPGEATENDGTTPEKASSKTDLRAGKGGSPSTSLPPSPSKKSPGKPSASPTKSRCNPEDELSTLIMSMRKLREAVVATHRVDEFTSKAYLFIIRATILTRHHESFHPALLHLLRHMDPLRSLAPTEREEVVGYMVLDLACRQRDYAGAFAARHRYGLRERSVDAVLAALVHDDYHAFWRVRGRVDGYKAKLMEYADETVRLQALKCVGRSYFSVDKAFVAKVTKMGWEEVKERYGVGWELEGQKIVIRRPKAR
ncbi:MAG: hypothetical protein M1833_001259 [Piccolia ochrophora]|nr:MAG: hypothetical protein M1833_001259 [Piccolia ochrophora]